MQNKDGFVLKILATVLREGPKKHSGKDYYLSIEILTISEVAKIISEVLKEEIKVNDINKEEQVKMFSMIPSPGTRNYMESAMITMDLTRNQKFKAQNELKDDVLTVVGRPGTKMKEWALNYFNKKRINLLINIELYLLIKSICHLFYLIL